MTLMPDRKRRPSWRRPLAVAGATGFSYVEVLVVVTLLAICLVPMMQALRSVVSGSSVAETSRIDALSIRSKMEEVLREPFASLLAAAAASGYPSVPSSYSDTILLPDGRQLARRVFIARYDGDNVDGDNDPFTGTDQELLYLRVEDDSQTNRLEILTSK